MRTKLRTGQQIVLHSNEQKEKIFTIKSVIKADTHCIIYDAYSSNNIDGVERKYQYRLKELFPSTLKNNITRKEDLTLIWGEDLEIALTLSMEHM